MGLVWSVLTYAARDGVIDQASVDIHETPNEASAIVEVLKQGDPITASNLPIEGFYKIRSQSGLVGWAPINALNLKPAPALAPLDQNGTLAQKNEIEKKPTHPQSIAIRLFGGFDFFSLKNVIPQYSSLGSGYLGGIELSVPYSDQLAIVLRSEYIFQSTLLTDNTTSITYQVRTQGIPVLVGPDYFWFWKSFSLELGAFAGVTWPTSFQVSQQNGSNVGAASSFKSKDLLFLGRVHLNWYCVPRLALFLEGGYRYVRAASFSPDTTGGTPGAILATNITIDLSGPILGGGIHFSF